MSEWVVGHSPRSIPACPAAVSAGASICGVKKERKKASERA